jgi:PAS domain S-box-containing protein
VDSGVRERRWFWVTLTLSSVTIVGFVFALWELIEARFFRDADYLTLHWLYISRGIGSALLLAFWAAWFVMRERRDTEEQLRRSRERYRGLLEFAPGAVAVYDSDLNVLEWNAAAEQLYGFSKSDAVGANLPTVQTSGRAELKHLLSEVATGQTTPDIETERFTSTGVRVPVQLNLSLFRDDTGHASFLEVTYDIRERVRLRQTLLSIEKLTTMGQMASGTAHHLNTPLASMLLRIRMARNSANTTEDLNELENSVRFCQHFVRRLLDFSRRPESRKQPEPIGAAIQSVIAFLKPQFLAKRTVVVAQIESLNGTQVMADRNELEALLLILLSNALDAVVSDGQIRVLAQRRGPSVEIAVADTGPGITEADQARIFEPFFTTKPVGIGTGLGLAIANNIVHEHGGAIRVASAVGKGTTMTVELPVWRQGSAAGGAA